MPKITVTIRVFRWGPAALLAAALVLATAAAARAQGNKPSDAPLPSCLDQSIKDELGNTLRPKGVQKREFLKSKHVELVLHGGFLAADLLSSGYLAGGALDMFFTEDFALELSLDVTPLALDLDTPLAEFFGDERFEPAIGYLGMINLLWSPVHAKVKMGDSIVHSDILLTAGAGRLFHDSVQGVSFNAGVVVELLVSRWATVRFEVRDLMAVQEAVAETRFTNNIIATLGFGLWIPTGL